MLRLNLTDQKSVKPEPSLVTICSPYGSTGKTTVAINLAAELAKSTSRVLLIDFDSFGPSIAAQLGMHDATPGLPAVSRLALQQRLTVDEITRFSIAIPGQGVNVLSSHSPRFESVELNASASGEIVRVALQGFDFVVADTSSLIAPLDSKSEITRELLKLASKAIVVAVAEPVGIYRLLQIEEEILNLTGNATLLVNRLRNSVVPQAKKEVTETLERLSKLELAGLLPDEQAAIDQATRQAIPLAMLSKSSSFRQALSAFARKEILGLKSPLDSRLAKLG